MTDCDHQIVTWHDVEVEHPITGEVWVERQRYVTDLTEQIGFGRWRCTTCNLVGYYTGSWRAYWERGIECPGSSLVPPHLRPAIMTTTPNRITMEASQLPTHNQLHDALESGATLTPIGRLIYDNEPAAPDQAKEFREQVAEALTEHGANMVARYGLILAEFKNFHRLLCERFGYAHDEDSWRRDLVSLIEHIAKQTVPVEPPTERALVPVMLIKVQEHFHMNNGPADCSQLPDGMHQLYAAIEVPL